MDNIINYNSSLQETASNICCSSNALNYEGVDYINNSSSSSTEINDCCYNKVDCYQEALPGLESNNNNIEEENIIIDNTDNFDGSIDTILLSGLNTDEQINIFDPTLIDQTEGLGIIVTKEDIRNKIVIINTFENKDNIELYYEDNENDNTFKDLKLFIDGSKLQLARGTYHVYIVNKFNKEINGKTYNSLKQISHKKLTVKTTALNFKEVNDVYLKTSFNRGLDGSYAGSNVDIIKH